jgi:hypothetical protein
MIYRIMIAGVHVYDVVLTPQKLRRGWSRDVFLAGVIAKEGEKVIIKEKTPTSEYELFHLFGQLRCLYGLEKAKEIMGRVAPGTDFSNAPWPTVREKRP